MRCPFCGRSCQDRALRRRRAGGDPDACLELEKLATFRVQLCDPEDPPEVQCQQERLERPPDVDGTYVKSLNIFGDFRAAVPTGTMIQQPDRLTLFRLGTVSNGKVTPTKKGSEMDRIFRDIGGRSSGEPATLSNDSLRIAFASGEFAVRSDTSLKTSGTDRATCAAW